MPTHQSDTTAESKSRLTSVRQAPVFEAVRSVQAGSAHSAHTASPHPLPPHPLPAHPVPARTVAARLARSSGGHLSRASGALLQLQRLRGNGYVQQVVGHARQLAPRRSAPVIQTKLTLGPADDQYEREADRVSREVVRWTAQRRMTDESRAPRLSPRSGVHRSATSSAGGTISAEDQHAIQQARGRGRPLASRVREPMEQAFGADFRNVRLHMGTQSERLTQSLQARAFTTGRDIFLGRGNPDLASRAGQELLAHELTHVVQQGQAVRRFPVGERPIHRGPAIVQRWPEIESESGKFSYFLGEDFMNRHIAQDMKGAKNKSKKLCKPGGDPHAYKVTVIVQNSLKGIKSAKEIDPPTGNYDWSLLIEGVEAVAWIPDEKGKSGTWEEIDAVIVSGYNQDDGRGRITHVSASQ